MTQKRKGRGTNHTYIAPSTKIGNGFSNVKWYPHNLCVISKER